MLELLNRYTHGLVAIPAIVVCREGGVFATMQSEGPMDARGLALRLNANEGHLRVALRLFESLGWIRFQEGRRYTWSATSEDYRRIPADVVELLAFAFRGYLRGETERGRERWFELATNGWGISDPLLTDFLDGLLTVPLAIAMGTGQLTAHECVRDWFFQHEWAVNAAGGAELTAEGRYLLDHVRNAGTVLSYAPMLLRLRELILGSPRTVFAADDQGRETHVERTLNVESCGLQHEKFFAGADELIIEIFNREPLERQPRYVVDMGCGDGSMLRRIFEAIRSRTARGTVLDAYPLTMVGAD